MRFRLNAKVSIAYLSDLERGRLSNPTLDKLRAIATELGLSVDDLLDTVEEGVEHRGSERPGGKARPCIFGSVVQAHSVRPCGTRPSALGASLPRSLTSGWTRSPRASRLRGAGETTSDYMFIFEAARRAIDR